MDNKVVLFKTHIWNDDIEIFAKKIKSEANSVTIDFFVLMHTETDAYFNLIKSDDIKKITLTFNEFTIKNIYNGIGFHSMWISNHWILMWFFKQHKNKYVYYWTIEYDVRIVGNSTKIWTINYDFDFIHPHDYSHNPSFYWINSYVGNKLQLKEKYNGLLQLARYSKKFLDYLDSCYESGENAQDELITFSLAVRGKFTISNLPLKSLIRGKWTWQNHYSVINKKIYNKLCSQNSDKVYILHPVK